MIFRKKSGGKIKKIYTPAVLGIWIQIQREEQRTKTANKNPPLKIQILIVKKNYRDSL